MEELIVYKYYVRTDSRGFITELSEVKYEGFQEITMQDKIEDKHFNRYYKVENGALVLDEKEREKNINYNSQKARDELLSELFILGML